MQKSFREISQSWCDAKRPIVKHSTMCAYRLTLQTHLLPCFGEMTVITDQKIKDHIWRDGDTLYYKLGVTDPDYCVLHFKAKNGRFYSNFSSTDFVIE